MKTVKNDGMRVMDLVSWSLTGARRAPRAGAGPCASGAGAGLCDSPAGTGHRASRAGGAALVALALALPACKSTQPQAVQPAAPAGPVVKKEEVKPTDRIGAANALFASGDYAGALKGYDAVIAKDPENESAVFNRAVTLQKLGENAQAKKAYEAILSKRPEDVDAALNLGALLKDEGRVDEAISVYNKALKKDEFNPRILNNLVVLHRQKKQYGKAVDAVRKLLMRDQRNIDAYKNLALVYYDQKKLKLAETILGNALKMAKEQNRKDPDIYVNLGMIHIAQGDNGKAMASFKEAVAIDPNHVIANYNIGSLALAHRDYDLAAKAYGVVAKAWPDSYAANVSLGYALQGQQKWEDAAKQLVKARELEVKEAVARNDTPAGDDEQVVFQLWQIYATAEQPDTAMKYADEYLKLKNKSCAPTDTDEVCGRYNGTKLMRDMKNQAPPAEEKKPKGGNVDIFKDAPAPGDETATEGGASQDGEAAPAEEAPATP